LAGCAAASSGITSKKLRLGKIFTLTSLGLAPGALQITDILPNHTS
jgi:hypothetical protein